MRLSHHAEIESIIERETLVLREKPTIMIEIQSLPADFDDQCQREIPTPVPPRLGVEKDDKGKVVFDTNGRPVLRYNYEDPDYREKKRVNAKLQAVKTIVDGLAPGQVEFAADKGVLGPHGYYVAVLEEMKQFGFGMGDLLKLVTAVARISGLSEKDIKAAELGFSMPAETSGSGS